jgi:hypothetical protein
MKASVGDRIVIASNRLDRPLRDGTIVELRHDDGSPPYLVEWSDTKQTALCFPGPDAHVEAPEPSGGEPSPQQLKTWRVEIDVFESGGDTTAHAVLVAGAEPEGVAARGTAHRNPQDSHVPRIGDEVAVARALRLLADRLLGMASDDIAAAEGTSGPDPVLTRSSAGGLRERPQPREGSRAPRSMTRRSVRSTTRADGAASTTCTRHLQNFWQ